MDSKKRKSKKFRFDVALSFSGKNRDVAEKIKEAAESLGLKVFYDKDQAALMWGNSEQVYETVYAHDSRSVVPLVSQDYLKSDYARHEFAIARREASNREHDYILPIRLDDSLLVGLPETTGYLSIERYSPDEIASILKQKLEATAEYSGDSTSEIVVLNADERLALGIIVTAALPRESEFYAALFPDLSWQNILLKLERLELVSEGSGILRPTRKARRAIDESSEEFRSLQARWLSHLEQVKFHIDIAPALALHYVQVQRPDVAVEVLSDVCGGTDLGWWNQIYLTVLETLMQRFAGRLKPQTRLLGWNALGICLSHASRYDEALKYYSKLRARAKQDQDDYFLGQSLINAGVASFHKGDRTRAIRFYEQARKHGTATRDWLLVGRALGNLAETYRETDAVKARGYLEESVKLKKKTGDVHELAAAEMQLGNLETSLGHPERSLPHFRRCVDLSLKTGDSELTSFAYHNIGCANLELGRKRIALRNFTSALEIGESDGYEYPHQLAATALGKLTFEMGLHENSKSAFTSLLSLAKKTGNKIDQACCLHAIAVIDTICLGADHAKRSFSNAVKFARASGLPHWYARCVADRTRLCENGTLGTLDIDAIVSLARRLERGEDYLFAGHVFLSAAKNESGDTASVQSLFRDAVRCLASAPDSETLVEALITFSHWQWQVGAFVESIETMLEAEQSSLEARDFMHGCTAADQAGVCLQHLSRYPEAIKAHNRAVRLARREGFVSLLEMLLNNLGEAQRHLGRLDEAEASLKEAEIIAAVHDEESAISIAHNRALVIQDKGDHAAAEALFKECRDRSRLRKFWREYIRAIEALANLACVDRQYSLSRRRYLDAIQHAKSKKFSDLLPRLSLNYAHLELFLGNPKIALREMRIRLNQVTGEPDEYLFHSVLGRAYSDTNQLTKAVDHLKIAASLAEKVGDKEQQLLALGMLAEVFEDDGRHTEAVEVLQTVIDLEEDIESKVWAMVRRVRIGLELEDGSAQITYDNAMELINRHRLHEANVDLHMTLGQHAWLHDDEERLQALQALIFAHLMALVHDIETDDDAQSIAGEVGAAILQLLTSPQTCVPQAELESLYEKLKDWAATDLSGKNIRKFALTICRWAIELVPLNASPKKFSDRLDELAAEEAR